MTDQLPTNPPPNRKGAMIALLLVIALIFGSVLLQRAMRTNSQMEDCLLAGRKNCAPLNIDGK